MVHRTLLFRAAFAVAIASFSLLAADALSAAPSAWAGDVPAAHARDGAHARRTGDARAPRRAGKRTRRSVPPAAPVRGVVNLNDATETELQRLPGVGQVKARRIVEWRRKHGPFKRIRDLRRVKGFGRKTVDKLAPHLALSGPTTLARARP
ncbi:MAG: helix-hairpin-helix domain-containing protein [Deltaproteobacteria bacterium]|nr:MAG: helix-hairpin-helix domain-containing protein [Deltaproteobacteria bacterium]